VLYLMLVRFLTFVRRLSLPRSSVVVPVFLTMLLTLPSVGSLRAAPPDDSEDSATAAIITIASRILRRNRTSTLFTWPTYLRTSSYKQH